MKASDIYFAAYVAAVKALPAESRDLIDRRNALANTYSAESIKRWRATGEIVSTDPSMSDLMADYDAAKKAVDADPLAVAALELMELFCRTARAEEKEVGK